MVEQNLVDKSGSDAFFLNHSKPTKISKPSKLLLFLKHFEHPVGDDEAADHIERAE